MTHRGRTLLALIAMGTTALAGFGGAGPAAAAPKPAASAYVVRDGTHLELGGKPFRFAGPNMYWTGLDENVGGVDPATPGTVDYPSYFRIRDGLTTAKAMGSTAVRAHTVGISTGNPKALEPTLGRFNDSAFATIDYTVAEAGRLGIKLVVPLTDNWKYYHGGRFDFLNWLGLSTADDGKLFYTDPDARAAYQQYLRHLLNHVNPRTGLRLGDDPTILAWELGNELNGMTPEWVQDNAAYVKTLAPHTLVAAGGQGGTDAGVLASSAVDISDSHYYPPTAARIATDAAAATAAGKVYLAGEFGSPQATPELLDQVAANPDVDGALFWSLFPHADHYGYVQHSDGFTLHFPGDNPAMAAAASALTGFAAKMTGRPTPSVLGDRPLLTSIVKQQGVNALTWRGTAGAKGYRVERSVLHGGWKTVSGPGLVSDDETPWLDLATVPTTSTYRVVAVAATGTATKVSAARTVSRTSERLVDPLEDWYLTSSHSKALRRTAVGGAVEVAPAAGKTGRVTWLRPRLTSATLSVAATKRPRPQLQVSTSGKGSWHTVVPLVTKTSTGRYSVSLSGPTRTGALRVVWRAKDGYALRSVALTSRATSLPATAPAAFSLTAPAPGATGVSTGAALSWGAAPAAAYYDLTVSTHADLSAPLVSVRGLQTTRYAPTTAWPGGTVLYVAVTAVNGAGRTAVTGSPVSVTTRAATPGVLVDDFDGYADDAELRAAYTVNSGGDPVTTTLAAAGEGAGHSLLLTYGTGPKGYSGVTHPLGAGQDWSATTGLRMWAEPGRAGQQLTVQFVANGSYWEATATLDGTGGRVLTVPFSAFAPPSWAPQDARLDLSSVTEMSLYPSATTASDTLRIDSVSATP